MKGMRQQAIRDLLDQRPVRTQQELVAALRERGFRATQATVSRDVAELGLVKRGARGVQAYALPSRAEEREQTGEDRLAKLLRDLPVEFKPAGLLLVAADRARQRPRHRREPRPVPLDRGRRQHRR